MANTRNGITYASFQTQGRLLQELGERLVAKPDVALMELIKNSYDADASKCTVNNTNDKIIISDNGHGMTEQDFLKKWMYIATPDKQRDRQSRRYKRPVTGSKGIGRFAVRFLGRQLRLETVAKVKGKAERTLLTVEFDWEKIDRSEELHTVRIPYKVTVAPKERSSGTILIISSLRSPGNEIIDKGMRTELLALLTPYSGLDSGDFSRKGHSKQDPGFEVLLPDVEDGTLEDLSSVIIDNYYAQVIIDHNGTNTRIDVKLQDGKTLVSKNITDNTYIQKGFHADIRYFPRRSGMFRGTSIDGRSAWAWIKKNGGVGIVDHGFRIRPYGYSDDDWLFLSSDSAYNRRTWRESHTEKFYPIANKLFNKAADNPALYLPKSHQLIGAVFVESSQEPGSYRPTDLTPSMDREGFVQNEGFNELRGLIRTGLEILAYADHQEQRRIKEARLKKETKLLRSDLRKAAAYIRAVPGLAEEDREKVVTQFIRLSKELSTVEEYYQLSSTKLDLMGLLGVIAGFVTHEMQRLFNSLDVLLNTLKDRFKSDMTISEIVADVESVYNAIAGQLDFSTAYIGTIQNRALGPEHVISHAAMKLITQPFQSFVEERGIVVNIDVAEDVKSPRLPRPLYNGVLMNLYTNALKATMGGEKAKRNAKVVLKAWNEPQVHIVEVADNGVGIPPELQSRIWDPLFTTTSSEQYNPLGSGMGLGLALVKKIVGDVKGRIYLVDPPPDYTTCFRVEYRR